MKSIFADYKKDTSLKNKHTLFISDIAISMRAYAEKLG